MKKVLILLGVFLLSVSCNNDLTDMNVDPINPSKVPAAALLGNAEKNLVDYMTSTNVNTNVFRLFAQHWTETTYLDESKYDILQRNVPDITWRTLYRDVLRDLKEAHDITAAETTVTPAELNAKNNRLAVIEMLSVYTYTVLVDVFGDVPYSEALDPLTHPSPKYDDAETIYTNLFARLNAALANVTDTSGSFGASDFIYGGNMANWAKFGNSLKLRMAITVADVPSMATLAQTSAEEAVTAGVISSAAENATLQYLSTQPNTNPLYEDLVSSGRYDFIAAEPLVDYMNSTNDPRRPFYFIPVGDGTQFIGGPYAQGGDFGDFSSPGDPTGGPTTVLLDPTLEGILLSYTEVEFYLAEAAERGWAVGGTAQSHYDNAITASILYWGGSSLDALAYLAQPSVNYLTATGTWQEKLGTQEWVAFYNRGFEAWTSWRRLDFPTLVAPANAASAAEGEIPKRFTYPVLEQTLNGTNYASAGSAIGGDKLKTHVFWDVN